MKSIKKVILTSVATIGMSAVLIGGATFALFTSESSTNIAVTSGKVNVNANISKVEAYSAKWDVDSNNYINDKLSADDSEGYSYTFANSGTVAYDADSNLLEIDRITPGDGVILHMSVTNESTVSVRYQTRVLIVEHTEDGQEAVSKLGDILEVKVSVDDEQETLYNLGEYKVSKWSEKIAEGAEIKSYTVEISMPWGATNDYQGLQCDIVVVLYAVQGNANVSDPYAIVATPDGLKSALSEIADGGTVEVGTDITITDDEPFEIPENTDVTIDLGGNSLNIEKDNADSNGFVINEGSTLTITGNEDENASFNLSVNADSDNFNGHNEGKYGMRVEKDSTLNLEYVDFNINNDQPLNHAIYVNGGTVNVDENSNINFYSNDVNNCHGFFVSQGGEMNLNGATLYSEGVITQIIVGFSENGEESTLNINAGTTITSKDGSNFCGVLETYQNGKINIHDGAKIVVTGKLNGSTTLPYFAAIRCVGAGKVDMDGGEIVLENITAGNALGIQVVSNWTFNEMFKDVNGGEHPNVDGLETGIFVDAHLTLSGDAKIVVDTASKNRVMAIFAAQRNGSQGYLYEQTGDNGEWEANAYDELHLADEIACIILKENFSVVYSDGTAFNGTFAYGTQGAAGGYLESYSPAAIKDER